MSGPRISEKPAYKWWVFSAVALGTLTSVVNHGGMAIALPTIAQHFDSDLSTAQWVVVAEGLAISALILPMGRLSDILGRKRVYVAGLAVFAVAALLAAGSQSILVLIAFKVVQGLGAAMTQGTGMAMIASAFPARERGKGIGLHTSVVGVGGVLGPVAGGFLITTFDWRWLFYVNVAMSLLALLAMLLIVKGDALREGVRSRSYDFPGAALSAAILLTFLLTVSNGARMGWSSPPIIAAAAGFVLLMAAFIWWESKASSPMLDLEMFRNRVFAIGISTNFSSFLGITSSRFLLPFYLQAALGYTPALIGIVLLPNAINRIVMGPISGWLSDRYGWRPFNILGLLLSAAGLFALAALTVSSHIGLVLAGIVLQSAGAGLFQSPNSASLFSAADSSKHGVVAAFVNLSRNAGNVTGIAIVTSIVTAVMATRGFETNIDAVLLAGPESSLLGSFMTGLKVAFLTMGAVQLIGAAASFFKTEAKDASTP